MRKWRKHYISCLLLGMLGACFSSLAKPPEGGGKVSMFGQIVDTACSIETESRDQIIDMGVIPISVIRQFGKAPPKSFNIKLIDCRWERYSDNKSEWESFDITFDGPANGDFFTVNGNAKGVQLIMSDDQGRTVIPGKPLLKKNITPGNMELNYQLQLVTDDKELQAGSYKTLLCFKIDYH